MPDLVLYVRGGENEELRYALRSWCQNLKFRKLCVVGGPIPLWLRPDIYIPNPKRWPVMRQCYENLLLATKDKRVAEDIIVVMDDVFVMKPAGSWEINYNRGTLGEQYKKSVSRSGTTGYNQLVRSTDIFLRHLYEEPLSFEGHSPFRCKKTLLRETLEKIGEKKCSQLLWRSVYGNTREIPTEYRKDLKVPERNDFWPTDAPVISTTERSFRGRVGVMLQDRFQRRSKYERTI